MVLDKLSLSMGRLGPKSNSTRLDRVAEFQTRIRPNIRVGSDISGNRLDGLELSVCWVWASDWAKILDMVKIIVFSFLWAFLAQVTQFGS